MTVESFDVSYEADGLAMRSMLFKPEAGMENGRGVVVFPDILGLGAHALDRARRLAEMGYLALAADVRGERRILSMGDIGPILDSMAKDRTGWRIRAHAAIEALLGESNLDETRLAAIGYCFGGALALELARSGADIAGVAGFHCALDALAPDEAQNIRGKILVCIGANDPLVNCEQRTAFEQEMRAADVDWRLHLYGGVVHSFTDPAADMMGNTAVARYDAAADARSWTEMIDFFEDAFRD